jgi:hypothetical protein
MQFHIWSGACKKKGEKKAAKQRITHIKGQQMKQVARPWRSGKFFERTIFFVCH